MNEDNTPLKPQNDTAESKKARIVRRIFKIFGWTVVSLIGLVLIILCGLSIYLTPERLTPLVEKYAKEFLNAEIKAESVELTIWSSFPHVRVDLKGIDVESHSLSGVDDSVRKLLPPDSDKLAHLNTATAGINLLRLITGDISLSNIAVDGLALNLVEYNDSINNYNIVPPSETEEEPSGEIPYITVDKVKFTNSHPVKYFSAASAIDATLQLDTLSVYRNESDNEKFTLSIGGKLTASSDTLKMLDAFPFILDGDLSLDQTGMNVAMSNYRLGVANIDTRLNVELTYGNDLRINKLEYMVNPFNIMETVEYIPDFLRPELDGIESDATCKATLKLNSPYSLSDALPPSVNMTMEIPDSKVKYRLENVGQYDLERIGMKMNVCFDGHNFSGSYVEIPKFAMSGDGVDFSITGKITELISDPLMEISTKGDIDFGKVAKYIPGLGTMNISGLLESNTDLRFHLSDITSGELQNFIIKGNANISNFIVDLPDEGMNLYARRANFDFGSDETSIAGKDIIEDMLMLKADVDTLHAVMPGLDLSVRKGVLKGGSTRELLTSIADTSAILPIGMSVVAERIRLFSETDSSRISMRNFQAGGSIKRFEGGKKAPLLTMVVRSDRMRYADRTSHISFRDINSSVTAHLHKRKASGKTRYQLRYDSIANANPGLSADSVASLARKHRRIPAHKDNEVVALEVDNGIKELFRRWDIHGSIKASRGVFANYIYPAKNRLSNIDFEFSLDSIVLRSLALRSQSNSMRLNGTIGNLRQLMLGGKRRPVTVRLNADIDTLNINQMAGTYERGLQLTKHFSELGYINLEEEDALETASEKIAAQQVGDSVVQPIIVPRNLDVDIKIRADKAYYTNLTFSDMGTDLIVKDGAFSIDSLRASTTFGNAYMNMLYNTRNPQKINMGIDLGFNRVDITNFLSSFKQIEEMMPMMSNLSGFVSAKLAGSFDLMQNMDIDFNSLNAVLDIRGNDMLLHQNDLIRKITRMMLIRNKGDIKINDMIIQASVHDNMLELYPFVFEFDRYKLAFMGENDFAENMYYHVSVLKSPIPFKFGINVKGTFSNPKLRFGGAKYKEDMARQLTNIVDNKRVNLVTEMKRCLNKFIKNAAMSDVGGPGFGLLRGKKDDDTDSDSDKSMQLIQRNFIEFPIKSILKHQDALKGNPSKK